MPLDGSLATSESQMSVPNDEWNGPWGSIHPVPNSVETLCVQMEPEPGKLQIHYYPYRTIGKWNWRMDNLEKLEIHVGGLLLKICGVGLRRLADALVSGQLSLVRDGPEKNVAGEIRVQSISIADD